MSLRCPNCGRRFIAVRAGQVFCGEVCKTRWVARREKHKNEVMRSQRLNRYRGD